MSQVENSRARSGQIVRPAAFHPGQQAPVDPGYSVPSDCDRQMCGCGSAYCGPGQDFCWYCMKQMMVKEIACLLKTDPELQAILNAPKMGVTDGSAEVPGQIGEFIYNQVTIHVPVVPAGQQYTTTVGALVVPPGFWLLNAICWSATAYQSQAFAVEPMPAGLATDLAANFYVGSGIEEVVLNSSCAYGNFTVPTLLPFRVWMLGQTGNSPAADTTVYAQGWRMR